MTEAQRSLTILVGGTPGTGKSTILERLKPLLNNFNFINLSQFAIDNDCIDGYDEELDTQIIDEDKLLEKLEEILKSNKLNVIECIHSDMISAGLVDKAYICRADTTKLYDRLKARNYNEQKISNNVEAEIFQLILDEARDHLGESKLAVLQNDNVKDLETNVKTIVEDITKLLS